MRYLLLSFLLFASCKFDTPQQTHTARTVDASKEIENWTCIPGKQVGLVMKDFSEADIIRIYGRENVGRDTIGLGEGITTIATTIFPKTEKEIFVSWNPKEPFQKISEILVEKKNAPWTTSQGIGIGTTLKQLKEINGRDFRFAGFEWDYSGFTKNWEGGNIPDNVAVFLEPSNPEAVYPDLLGDELFSSNHPKALAAGLKVRAMIFYFE